MPRRAAILAIVSQIESLNQQTLARQEQDVEQQQRELPIFVRRAVILSSLLGLAVALLTLYWINRLERVSQTAQRGIEKAGHELRRLSQQLVHAQEEERKRLSHELHDEVGQLLTALRIELGNLDEARKLSTDAWNEQLAATKGLAERSLRTVRDLAMGLRPAMLDELGLVPAIQWQSREHSRRTGVPVSVQVAGDLDELPEEHRTCVYRIIQEALTNIARHAHAHEILIQAEAREGVLSIEVKDDGVGFEPRSRNRRGLGLLGMTERVKKLGGELQVVSQPGQGSSIVARMPLTKGPPDIHHEENLRLVSG
jgi:signal transduction histidine kinase